MPYVFLIVGIIFLAFAAVIFRGAPYLPTFEKQGRTAIELLGLQPGQTLLELGSGDGKVIVLAAKAGLNVVGIELNPFLVFISWFRTRRYRKQVRIIWGDFWLVRWPAYDGVFTFLLDRYMARLDNRMQVERKPLVSFAFKIPHRKPTAVKDGVYLYRYE
jgi:SAM-dependent methyltransferase